MSTWYYLIAYIALFLGWSSRPLIARLANHYLDKWEAEDLRREQMFNQEGGK